MVFKITLIFIGGGIGSVFRFLLGYLFSIKKMNSIFATLSANLISCIIIALVLAEAVENKNTNTQIFWAVGFCGGLSTFSTFSWQNWQLAQNQQWSMLAFNVIANLILTIVAIGLGLKFSSAI